MALTIGDNFQFLGSKPLDARLKYNTVAAMKAMADSTLYDGCMAYCVATDKTYQWKSTNEVDATLGKWREFESGGSVTVDDELSDTSTNPVQNAVIKEALDGKADLVDGKVPAAQLPSYVDDVLEYEDRAHFPATGEAGKIYVALDTNKTYRWSGSDYVEISESLALGETSSTAYRGDRGKIAYEDSQANKAAIGDLTELETTDKTDLVGAINEVKNSGGYTAGDGIDITNKEIKTKNMSSDDMSEVASPMPGVMNRLPVLFDESGAERVVGWYKYANGTKKPVYEKNFTGTATTSNQTSAEIGSISNIDALIFSETSNYLQTLSQKQNGLTWIIGDTVYVRQTSTTDTITFNYLTTYRYTKTTDTAS